jgi:hypothetical protein
MTKKVAALEEVTSWRLVLIDQRFRETYCSTSMAAGSSEEPVHADQTARRHIIISFINYIFDDATMSHGRCSVCGKQILVKNCHLAIRIRIFIEKRLVAQLVKIFRAFYGCQSSLPHSQEPVTGHYSQTDESIPYPPNIRIVYNN